MAIFQDHILNMKYLQKNSEYLFFKIRKFPLPQEIDWSQFPLDKEIMPVSLKDEQISD